MVILNPAKSIKLYAPTTMRLICGLFHLDGSPAEKQLLRSMAAQMAVAGFRPGLGLWLEGPVGLAVLDFSVRGAVVLPDTGTSIMAADVRLDATDALAEVAGCDGIPQDDAVIGAAVESWGGAGLDRVLGDFAFASWDRDAQVLTCGRDVFGVRPFAYVHKPGKLFAFASFPKGLHGAGVVPKRLDETALARHINRNLVADDSLIAGINRLPAAHYLEVSRDRFSLERYWQPDPALVGTNRCSAEEAARELRRLLTEAVACRLPKRGTAGAHLSGGLDSSAIAVLAARRLAETGDRLRAYSFLDRQRNDIVLEDESAFVQSVLERESNIDWTPVRPPVGFGLLDGPMDSDRVVSLLPDQPENALGAQAQAAGVDLLLSGWGGDECVTFNGESVLTDLFLQGRWRKLLREVAAISRERDWPKARIIRTYVLSRLWQKLIPPALAPRLGRMIGLKPKINSYLHATLTQDQQERFAEPLQLMREKFGGRRRIMSPHIALQAEVLAAFGARQGLAYAFPMLDRRLVEFALSLPSELFLRDGFGRRVFRDAMIGVLPDRVRLRHIKLQQFPSRGVDIAASKQVLLVKIDAFETIAAVRDTIDLALLRREIEAFPSPERYYEYARQGQLPPEAPRMLAVIHALTTAAYIAEHGGGQVANDALKAEGEGAAA